MSAWWSPSRASSRQSCVSTSVLYNIYFRRRYSLTKWKHIGARGGKRARRMYYRSSDRLSFVTPQFFSSSFVIFSIERWRGSGGQTGAWGMLREKSDCGKIMASGTEIGSLLFCWYTKAASRGCTLSPVRFPSVRESVSGSSRDSWSSARFNQRYRSKEFDAIMWWVMWKTFV